MSLFDPKSFLSTPSGAANATKSVPLPVGSPIGQITKIDIGSGEKDNKTWYSFEAFIEITDRDYLSKWAVDEGKAEKASIRYNFFLDTNEGGGISMGPGRNVKLGLLREATGTNDPDKALDAMVGKMVRPEIFHKPDPDNSAIVYANVKGVTRA